MSKRHVLPERPILTFGEFGQLVGLGKNAMTQAVRRGHIPTIRIGARFYIPRIALDRLYAGQAPTEPVTPPVRERALAKETK